MKKIIISIFILGISIVHPLCCMDNCFKAIEATLELGRKQELLEFLQKSGRTEAVIFTEYTAEQEPIIKARTDLLIASLASVNPALTIIDTDPDNPKLLVNLSRLVASPLLKREVVVVDKPLANAALITLQKILNNPGAVRFLHDGVEVVVTNQKRDEAIGIIRRLLATITEDERGPAGPIINLSELAKLTGPESATKTPTLWQSLGKPVVKSVALIGIGYLLCTYMNNQEN